MRLPKVASLYEQCKGASELLLIQFVDAMAEHPFQQWKSSFMPTR